MFITFEGLDGCGKSTQARLLQEYLTNKDIPTILTKEPGGTPEGQKIRSILLDKVNKLPPVSEVMLFYADRLHHVENLIKPKIIEGYTVISDRFSDSTIAYQTASGVDWKTVETIHKLTINDFQPDITFFLDISVKSSIVRIGNRGEEINRIEFRGAEYFIKVRSAFIKQSKKFPNRFVILDGEGSVESIHKEIVKYLEHG